MATPVLNSLITQASAMVQEYRNSALAIGDTGMRWKSSNWTAYANRALREFLSRKLNEMGVEGFVQLFPEYVKEGAAITLVNGAVAKPIDALVVIDLIAADLSVRFDPLKPESMASVKTGRHGTIVPSAAHPVFWEEIKLIKTLGVTSGGVLPRYVVSPGDLAPSVTAAGSGKVNSAAGEFEGTTKVLKVTVTGNFAAEDVGRKIMLHDTVTNAVYFAIINAFKDADEVYLIALDGTTLGLPPDTPGATIDVVLVEQISDADVLLNQLWHGEIIRAMARMAVEDAENGMLE